MKKLGKIYPNISLARQFEKERRSAWARLLAKIYEVHAFTCPKCSSDMEIIAVIMDPAEIRKIPAASCENRESPAWYKSCELKLSFYSFLTMNNQVLRYVLLAPYKTMF